MRSSKTRLSPSGAKSLQAIDRAGKDPMLRRPQFWVLAGGTHYAVHKRLFDLVLEIGLFVHDRDPIEIETLAF